MTCSDGSLTLRESVTPDGGVLLSLRGCLDIATAPQLDLRLRELELSMRHVKLNLEALTFVDLVGLRVIHSRVLGSRLSPALFSVAPEVGPCVRRLLQLTGVDLWPAPRLRTVAIRALLGTHAERTRGAGAGRPRTGRR